MRRIILEEPFSRSAIWSRNLAVFALFVAVIGIALARRGVDPTSALAIVGGAMALAGLSILFALVAMAVIWRTGFRGVGLAAGGLVLSALLLAYPAYLAVQARTVPPVPDISTDLDEPPAFLTSDKARAGRHGLLPGPMTAAAKDLETKLYPDLDTLTIDADVDEVFAAVRRVVRKRHWEIVDESDPSEHEPGRIDAVAKTLVMGFPADIAIRVRQSGDQTQVDVRSVARAGWQEPGSNAARVKNLIDDIDVATSRG